jgi:cell division transport system permease protein
MNNSKINTSKPSYRYAVISISIVLYFLGIYIMLYLQSGKIDQMIKEQVSIVVELKDSLLQSEKQVIEAAIKRQTGVIVNSISYYGKSSASKIMGDDVLTGFRKGESPFKDMMIFRLQAESYTNENLNFIDKSLMKERVVHDIFFESESDIGVHDLVHKLSLLFLLLSVIFVALALIIIHNTLSLSLYADRWEIKTMELVGARRSFIRKPYVAHGRIIGQRAFLLAAIALLGTVGILYLSISVFGSILYWPYLILTLVILFVLSTLITMVSTFTVVNKFLEQKLSELHG